MDGQGGRPGQADSLWPFFAATGYCMRSMVVSAVRGGWGVPALVLSQSSQTPKIIASDLYFAIFKAFREAGVEIPFPQRDLHLKTVSGEAESALGGRKHEKAEG